MTCEAEVLPPTSEVSSVHRVPSPLPPSMVVRDGYHPHLVVLLHGILTGSTEPDWSDSAADWLKEQDAQFRTITAEYYGLPLPRIQALRNRKKAQALIRRVDARARELETTFGIAPRISLVGHSNGGILVDQVAEGLIERGWRLEGLLFMASAVRATRQTARCSQWISEGRLEKAGAILAEKDKVIGLLGVRLPFSLVQIVAWPWGALGREGWNREAMLRGTGDRFSETVVDSNHGNFLSWENRYDTFRQHIGPFLGWSDDDERRAA